MTIRYIANIRIPTEKAHGIQITSMCRAFAEAGVTLELVVPYRADIPEKDVFAYYDVPEVFTIRRLRTLPFLETVRYFPSFCKPVLYTLHRFNFAWCAKADARRNPADVYYHRDEFAFRTFALSRLPSIWELHVVPRRLSWYRAALEKALLVVTITNAIRDDVLALGLSSERVLCAPDGADLAQFSNLPGGQSAKAQLGLPEEKILAVYTGQLFAWKGVDTLVSGSASFPPGVEVVIVGGAGSELAALQARVEREQLPVRAIGQVAHAEIPLYLAAADIVVIPNSGATLISSRYTSPLKLFEALAASKAIVSSDLPSLREILSEDCAVLVPPDSPEKLAAAITALAHNPEQRARLGAQARERAKDYDWSARATKILSALELHASQGDATISETLR